MLKQEKTSGMFVKRLESLLGSRFQCRHDRWMVWAVESNVIPTKQLLKNITL